MSQRFVILAGKKAIPIIRDEGLDSERVQVVAGAAGGPKWLVLYGLDRLLFGSFFKDRREPLYLIGSSIGAWRFAAASVNDPVAAIDNLKEAYSHQRYSARPSPADVSHGVQGVLDSYIGDDEIRQILSHPTFRPSMLAVRCRQSSLAAESFFRQTITLAGAAMCNAVDRSWLGYFFQRTLFHHPADNSYWGGFDDFPEQQVALNEANFRKAVMASGSIPLIMSGVHDIPGAAEGVYLDGGIIDYHLNLPFPCDPDRIVLFPHYAGRVIPGWLDKKVFWRKPIPDYMNNVVLVAPSPGFVADLPFGKISDRKDFQLFQGRDAERIKYWQTVIEQGCRLADDFNEAVISGKVREMVKPL